jgi:hypothetical protein
VAVEKPEPTASLQEPPWRYLVGISAAAIFAVLGVRMLLLGSEEFGVFVGLMGWFSFGMALLTIVVMLPRPIGR